MPSTMRAANLLEVTTHLRVGALDFASSRELRQVLSQCAEGPRTHLLVDLSRADGDHDMTIYALLAGKADSVNATGGEMTVIPRGTRLSQLTASLAVAVAYSPLPPHQVGSAHETFVGHFPCHGDTVSHRHEVGGVT
jgi:anti-anti-sigma regulatory factor